MNFEERLQHPGLYEEECCQQVDEGEPSSLLSTQEATPEMLGLLLGSSAQKTYGLTGATPVQGHKGDSGTGASFWRG